MRQLKFGMFNIRLKLSFLSCVRLIFVDVNSLRKTALIGGGRIDCYIGPTISRGSSSAFLQIHLLDRIICFWAHQSESVTRIENGEYPISRKGSYSRRDSGIELRSQRGQQFGLVGNALW